MKREIKFRAWDKNKKIFLPDDVYALLNKTSFGAFGIMIKNWDDYIVGEFFYDNAQEISQFTGLHDKNGREVYEGDIICCTVGCSHEVIFVKEMGGMFMGGMPGFNLSGMLMSGGNGYAWTGMEEIIGNIYENPELLKA